MLGGLHIEMALWNNVGKLLENSQWTEVLGEANILTSGRANSVLHASHVKRACCTHEVSAVAFDRAKTMAYRESDTEIGYSDWIADQCSKLPTFIFWDLIMRLQLMVLTFTRSIRERNIELYTNILEKLLPLFFALDSTNYTRWFSIHVRDLKNLPASIQQRFKEKLWTVTRSDHNFSSIAIDQGETFFKPIDQTLLFVL